MFEDELSYMERVAHNGSDKTPMSDAQFETLKAAIEITMANLRSLQTIYRHETGRDYAPAAFINMADYANDLLKTVAGGARCSKDS